jgi:hypothetical protein
MALFSPEIVDQIFIIREQVWPLFLAEIVDHSLFFSQQVLPAGQSGG